MKEAGSRQGWLDILRIAAMIAVVVLHITATPWYSTPEAGQGWLILNFWSGIVRWAVPVFVMISGAIFLDPARELPVRRLYGKYLLRIAIAFAFWGIVYLAEGDWLYPGRENWNRLMELLHGHYHMWYLLMLAGLYLITPVMRQIVRSREAVSCFLLLSLVFGFLIPTVDHILGNCNDVIRSELFWQSLEDLRYTVSLMDVHLPIRYSGYYLLGYVLSQKTVTRRHALPAAAALAVCLAAVQVYTVFFSRAAGLPLGFYEPFDLPTLGTAASVFILVRALAGERGSGQVTAWISARSFGVYLAHPLILELAERYLHLRAEAATALYSVPLLTIGAVAASLALSALLCRIPVLGKQIV